MEQEIYSYRHSYENHLIWDITNYCNLTCHQCAGNTNFTSNKQIDAGLKLKNLSRFMKKLKNRTRITITGGEPFLIKDFVEACRILTKNHVLSVITNLTLPLVVDFAAQIKPEKVYNIVASAHIKELKKRNLLSTFIENCKLLKEKGFDLNITEVAYPFEVDNVSENISLFQEHGLKLSFYPFRGQWKQKQYPQEYTEAEIKAFSFNDSPFTNPKIYSNTRRICNAGFNIGIISRNGFVFPCPSIMQPIGELYKKVKFNKKLVTCEVEMCDCPFPNFDPNLFKNALTSSRMCNKDH